MQALGMLLLAAATVGDGFGYGNPGVGGKKWFRHDLVSTTGATAPPPYTAASMAAAGGMGANNGRRFTVTKSQIYFLDPNGMQIGWQNGTGPNGERSYLQSQLTVPARYNFNQGYIYRLKITNIPGRPTVSLYPTLEVAPTTPATDAYLAHNIIPVQFTAEDFDQVVDGGNFVTKVIYLPDPKYQELAISGVETLVSTRLEPGVDPILEADKRGTILLIVRVGAIDLETPNFAGAGSPIVGAPLAPGTIVNGPISGGAVMGSPITSGPITGGTVIGSPIMSGPITGGVVVGAPITSGSPAQMPAGTLPPGVVPAVPGNVILDPAAPGTTPPPPAPGVTTPAPPTPGPAVPNSTKPAPAAPTPAPAAPATTPATPAETPTPAPPRLGGA